MANSPSKAMDFATFWPNLTGLEISGFFSDYVRLAVWIFFSRLVVSYLEG